MPQPSPTPSVTQGTAAEIPRAQLTMEHSGRPFPMGVGSLFYALLITATIYKFTTNIKSSQRLDFKWNLPVTESLLFVIPGFMSCCTTKWDCPLVPLGGTGRGPQASDRDRSPLRLGCRECNLWPLVLGAPCCHSLGLGVLRGEWTSPCVR